MSELVESVDPSTLVVIVYNINLCWEILTSIGNYPKLIFEPSSMCTANRSHQTIWSPKVWHALCEFINRYQFASAKLNLSIKPTHYGCIKILLIVLFSVCCTTCSFECFHQNLVSFMTRSPFLLNFVWDNVVSANLKTISTCCSDWYLTVQCVVWIFYGSRDTCMRFKSAGCSYIMCLYWKRASLCLWGKNNMCDCSSQYTLNQTNNNNNRNRHIHSLPVYSSVTGHVDSLEHQG